MSVTGAVPVGVAASRLTCAAKTAAVTRNPWIRSPAWDGFWVLSTLWVLPLIWTLGMAEPDAPGSPVQTLYLILTLCFWVGHRFSSAYLAYFTTSYRPLLRSQRTRFVWVPVALAVALFAFLVPPDDALPWDRVSRMVYLIILDYGLISWHFASQHYGFLSLYRVRAGQARSATARRLDRAYALVMGGLMVVLLALASIVLLPIMEVELVLTGDDSSLADEIVPGLVSGLANSWFAPALVALGFVTAFLHYQLDRAVFRLSDPEVRRAARGLFD